MVLYWKPFFYNRANYYIEFKEERNMTNEELDELEFCTQNVCFLTDEFEATNDKGTILTLRNFGKLAEIFLKNII